MLKKLLPFTFFLVFCFSLSYAQDGYYIGVYNSNTGQSCSDCHSEEITAWEGTGHAIAQDSVSSDHYGYSCLQCHNTGWNPDVNNGGADEYVE